MIFIHVFVHIDQHSLFLFSIELTQIPVKKGNIFQKIAQILHFYLTVLYTHRIPSSTQVVTGKQHKKQHIVSNHATPGGYQAKTKQMNTDKGSCDSHTPHSRYIENKRSDCFSYPLHHSLNYNGNSVKRL